MPLQLPDFTPLPAPPRAPALLEVPVARLRPTQMCVGLAEVQRRVQDFKGSPLKERRAYLKRKPVPLVRNGPGHLWMVDRHHRLRALLQVDPEATAFGYVVLEAPTADSGLTLRALQQRGWLYLHNRCGQGPWPPEYLPQQLSKLQDDAYRSLVWRLKQEGAIAAAPSVPFHEFRWGAWLRRCSLPAFHSLYLELALPTARHFVCSPAASVLAGWQGRR
ncbi:MAG: plasmid partitioning protein ParB [Candidatus Synechococcus spongiarum SP3]|uniref:Plasmid partitioning protein ParB n=1 Tax=Candidatus Synechococcus spongiarum SP3 TaxID=1604020 RepID=A0A0G2HNR0_9SYNE|nr:MAG: plasmid partitioning protein ParB [Candidatus Synechococcus spongiarum SP3]